MTQVRKSEKQAFKRQVLSAISFINAQFISSMGYSDVSVQPARSSTTIDKPSSILPSSPNSSVPFISISFASIMKANGTIYSVGKEGRISVTGGKGECERSSYL